MKYGVIGVGGVGGFYGGMLANGGKAVVFIGKSHHVKVFKSKGLTVESFKHGKFTVRESDRVVFSDSFDALKDVDVVLLCVKSYDTEEIARKLSEIDGKFAVVSVQNGIENEEILAKYLGSDRVIGATAFIGAYVKEPGVVVHEAAGLLEIGEVVTTTVTDRIRRIAEDMAETGIEIRILRDINYTLWKKLMWNVAFNPYSVVTRATVGEMLEHPETFKVLERLMEECMEVAKAWGVELKKETMEKYLKSSPDLMAYKTSMLLDFERGKPLEIEGITGALIRKAKKKGIDVPCNHCVYATVLLLDEKRKK
ncbi:ketopantoate reductase family protein [Desulfurobacterium sp.]